MPRRIVGHVAGTWGGGTNVVRLVQALREKDDSGNDQLAYFDLGIGAGTNGRTISRHIAGATGFGISRLIKDLYNWLSNHFRPDDQIYLFGFSRGAYGVRSLAGLISHCGVVTHPDPELIDQAFRLYKLGDAGRQAAFKARHSHPRIDIRMIGVWDSVETLGMPIRFLERFNPLSSDFHNVSLNPEIHSAYHALAIDEQRKHFRPVLWEESNRRDGQYLEQVWFAGSHSDIGGQTTQTDHSLSEITLLWMMEKAREQGLAFKSEAFSARQPAYDGAIDDSRSGLGRLWPRQIRSISVSRQTLIHASVKQRVDDARVEPRYAPEALHKLESLTTHYTIVGNPCGSKWGQSKIPGR